MHVDQFLPLLQNVKECGSGHSARCPGHEDRENSLSISSGTDGRILLHCFAGCTPESIVGALHLGLKDLFPDGGPVGTAGGGEGGVHPPGNDRNTAIPTGLTLEELAEAKKLPLKLLQNNGLRNFAYNSTPSVRIQYLSTQGEPVAVRFRVSLVVNPRFFWRKGDKPTIYGLHLLEDVRKQGYVILVEGESDCWTAWHHGLPALGIPGKTNWKETWREYLVGLQVYLWQEPEAEDLVDRVAEDVPELLVIPAPPGIKDLSEAHLQGRDVPKLLADLRATAIPASELKAREVMKRRQELQVKIALILAAPDPIVLVREGLQRLGYGGDLRYPLIVYLAATSRLLAMRAGTMPVHLLIVGVPSSGKSYTLRVVLNLLPPEAFHKIDAGSERVLIYDDADLEHRVIIFSEADSLPSGEDNCAASAIRNLLQDHELNYKVTERDTETGKHTVREIRRSGPSVLFTTAVKRLGSQLDSRLFSMEVPDDQEQVRRALATQASLELNGSPVPDQGLIVFQAYLQTLAPFDVVVPFIEKLGELIGKTNSGPRILRDFARLISLIKAVTVLRHRQRKRDGAGRLVAEIPDYALVHDLIGDMYEGTVTGASKKIRETVAAVDLLQKQNAGGTVSVTEVGVKLGISTSAASRRVNTAIRNHWLVNEEKVKGKPSLLKVGESLPDRTTLPSPEALEGCCRLQSETGRSIPPSPPGPPGGAPSEAPPPAVGEEGWIEGAL